jgi:DNA-binding NarL/FixJ family response regulator
LNEAIGVFDSLDAHPWSERARTELRATGERVSARSPATNEALTPQELQVAILAADGKTNREVGKQLFLSPKTIEWHLGHVYRKLGISSRSKLVRALEERQLVASPPGSGTELR